MIHSPCLKSIEIHPAIDWKDTRPARLDTEPDALTESMDMIHAVWSFTVENLVIGQHYANSSYTPWPGYRFTFSQSIIDVLKGLHGVRTFHINGWRIEKIDNTLEALVTSWPKLTTLILPVDQMSISFSTLTVIAERCPRLRYLQIRLLTSTIPPFNPVSSFVPCYDLGVLSVGSDPTRTNLTLQCKIRVARYLDLLFPGLEDINTHSGFSPETWLEIHELVELFQEVRQ